MKSWLLRWLLSSAWILACLSGCAGVQRAADEIGEKGTAAAGGTLLGGLLFLLHPAGILGGLLAAAGGAIGALLFGGGDTTVHAAPTSAWDAAVPLAALVLFVLLLRAWAHWLPPLLEVLKRAALGTPRALLGGRPKKTTTTRFVRRAD